MFKTVCMYYNRRCIMLVGLILLTLMSYIIHDIKKKCSTIFVFIYCTDINTFNF